MQSRSFFLAISSIVRVAGLMIIFAGFNPDPGKRLCVDLSEVLQQRIDTRLIARGNLFRFQTWCLSVKYTSGRLDVLCIRIFLSSPPPLLPGYALCINPILMY